MSSLLSPFMRRLRSDHPLSHSQGEEFQSELLSALADNEAITVEFEAANYYGLSAKSYDGFLQSEGKQLNNNRSHHDTFKINRCVGENRITIESLTAPGLFIGVGPRCSGSYAERSEGFEAVLVTESDPSKDLVVVPARNSNHLFDSFEPVAHPGYLLHHCDGIMWFFNKGAYGEGLFSKDASWKIHLVETIQERAQRVAQRLQAIQVDCEDDDGSLLVAETECPICMISWEQDKMNKIQVVANCGHTFCMQCVLSMCKMRSSTATSCVCAICRASIQLKDLKRIIRHNAQSFQTVDETTWC
jgi:hypothetical protein